MALKWLHCLLRAGEETSRRKTLGENVNLAAAKEGPASSSSAGHDEFERNRKRTAATRSPSFHERPVNRLKRVVEEVVVTDPLGIHARPAAALAVAVGRSGARVTVALGAKKTSGASVVGLLSLGATYNSTVIAEVEGEDGAVEAVIAALHRFLASEPQA